MNLNIEISDEDYETIAKSSMTVSEMYDTLKGRLFSAIARAYLHRNDYITITKEDVKDELFDVIDAYDSGEPYMENGREYSLNERILMAIDEMK